MTLTSMLTAARHDWEQVAAAVATGLFDTVLCWCSQLWAVELFRRALYISLVMIHTKYNKARLNDCTAHGYCRCSYQLAMYIP